MSIIRGDAQGLLLPRGQLDLFPEEAREYERTVRTPCRKCGREIIVSEPIKDGNRSEYQDKRGWCWGCAIEAKRP